MSIDLLCLNWKRLGVTGWPAAILLHATLVGRPQPCSIWMDEICRILSRLATCSTLRYSAMSCAVALHSLLMATIWLGLLDLLSIRGCALLLLAKLAQTAGVWHGFALFIATGVMTVS